MRVQRSREIGVAAAVAMLLLACASSPAPSRIPGFAQPRLMEEGDAVTSDDVIGYRALTRDDFRAAGPPAYLGDNSEKMGAVTCAMIRSKPGAAYEVRITETRTVVRAVNFGFEAVMDRQCSWWNAGLEVFPESYVLEHEQVHLAIFEAQARQLNRRVPEVAVATGAKDADPQQLSAQVRSIIEGELDAAKDAVLERSLAFDEDTSFGHAPELQQQWRRRVERELRELQD